MGRVMITVKLTNCDDQAAARLGLIPPEKIRSLQVEALIDTGATTLILPARIAEQLGLRALETRPMRFADGRVKDVTAVGLEFEMLGRSMLTTAYVVTPGALPLVGQIQLEHLDLIVDPNSQEVRPNPEHPDGPLADAF